MVIKDGFKILIGFYSKKLANDPKMPKNGLVVWGMPRM